MEVDTQDVSVCCNLCSFETTDRLILTRHIVRDHKHDTRFSVCCSFPECGQVQSYNKWDSFRRHLRRKHRGLHCCCLLYAGLHLWTRHQRSVFYARLDATGVCSQSMLVEQESSAEVQVAEDSSTSVGEIAPLPSSPTTHAVEQRDAARFLLHCATRFSMPYTAVDGVAELTEELIEQVTTSLSKRVATVLESHGASDLCRSAIENVFQAPDHDLFNGLKTQHSREIFYTTHFNLVVNL